MRTICKLLPLVLLASALSLSSCVNQVKDQPKTQVQDTTKGKDTLSRLAIVFNIPDSNKILTIDFHTAITPPWQKNYRLDWNFGDGTGVISKFDTSNLTHYYQKNGTYVVSLGVFDTVKKILLGNTSVIIELGDNAVDTNFLHRFTKVSISLTGTKEYMNTNLDVFGNTTYTLVSDTNNFILIIFNNPRFAFPSINWSGNDFQINGYYNWDDTSGKWNLDQGNERFTFSGHISYSGNLIDSGSFMYSYFHFYMNRPGEGADGEGTILQFKVLPIQEKDLKKITYVNSGSELQPILTQFNDSTSGGYNRTTYSHKFQNVLWNQPPLPVLTVTFYK